MTIVVLIEDTIGVVHILMVVMIGAIHILEDMIGHIVVDIFGNGKIQNSINTNVVIKKKPLSHKNNNNKRKQKWQK
jgi:hypothetical protein